ncbi:MAG: hypothetical protein KAI43_03485 [Candidatus Aureabacteria bacterium]|nr:hypothetical protein [Candidatus Auribacterota bacterium]
MTKDNQLQKQIHIGIFELRAEAESVLTLSKMFKHCGYKVSLFLSLKIWERVKDFINRNDVNVLQVFEDDKKFIDIHEKIKVSIESNKIDLIIFPRFESTSYRETKSYIKFFNEHKVIVGMFNHDRWFSAFPKFKFNGFKLIKRSFILDWFYCHLVFKHISAYFMSEIHRYSENPLKMIIHRKTDKKVFDLPFKLMDGNYNPNIEYEFPVFVIPGAIQKERRDYLKVLKCFLDPVMKRYKWKMILLGRPIGRYGKKILEMADHINSLMGGDRIEYIREYISKEEFDRFMNMSTHILAPVNKAMFKYGKDSGALYDVFKYNKIGIFEDFYFYSKDLIEKKVILTFKSENDLKELLSNIIMKKYSYDHVSEHFQEMSSYLEKNKYIDYAKNEMASLL